MSYVFWKLATEAVKLGFKALDEFDKESKENEILITQQLERNMKSAALKAKQVESDKEIERKHIEELESLGVEELIARQVKFDQEMKCKRDGKLEHIKNLTAKFKNEKELERERIEDLIAQQYGSNREMSREYIENLTSNLERDRSIEHKHIEDLIEEVAEFDKKVERERDVHITIIKNLITKQSTENIY